MDENWAASYQKSARWSTSWAEVTSAEGTWPEGFLFVDGKLFSEGKLCVPEDLANRVIREHHVAAAHAVGRRFIAELKRRFVFSPICHI